MSSITSIKHSIGYTPLRLSSAFRATVSRFPNKPAVIFQGKTWNYRQLGERVSRLAQAIVAEYNLEAGDVIALISTNSLEFIETVFGLSEYGMIIATLNPRSSEAELDQVFGDCKPKLAILDGFSKEPILSAQRANIPSYIISEKHGQLIEAGKAGLSEEEFDEDAPFCMCYTSGTTGSPKGVLISHRSRALTIQAMQVEYDCFGPNDKFLALAPMYHGAGFVFAASAISFGACCEVFTSNDPAALANRLGEGDISGIFLVPTHFNRLFKLSSEALLKLSRGHNLKTIISNAAALSQDNKVSAIKVFGEGILHETYGSTEAGIVTNIRPEYLQSKPGSVGVPFVNTLIEIRREDGSICNVDEIGLLYSKAPYTFSGYLNQDEETRAAFSDNWVTVRDLAKRDKDGFITICGRSKDMVISGGVNIYPSEIEDVILRLEGIEEVAIVGLPDAEWGEKLHAFAVLKEGFKVSTDTLIDFCREHLSSYKVPKGVSYISEIPRNQSGKILKKVLRNTQA